MFIVGRRQALTSRLSSALPACCRYCGERGVETAHAVGEVAHELDEHVLLGRQEPGRRLCVDTGETSDERRRVRVTVVDLNPVVVRLGEERDEVESDDLQP